ncbi:hypothetical protein CDAR_27681 [Caerostris darwini]|uniref:Uncharacterized protein n=1 Tax=Caerostris darwini TaxID=1538125 RepID=A0AAV4SVZ4_9ARAC|nr:hypothetical protein CDAR_27681 [Caerostris darwini]
MNLEPHACPRPTSSKSGIGLGQKKIRHTQTVPDSQTKRGIRHCPGGRGSGRGGNGGKGFLFFPQFRFARTGSAPLSYGNDRIRLTVRILYVHTALQVKKMDGGMKVASFATLQRCHLLWVLDFIVVKNVR